MSQDKPTQVTPPEETLQQIKEMKLSLLNRNFIALGFLTFDTALRDMYIKTIGKEIGFLDFLGVFFTEAEHLQGEYPFIISGRKTEGCDPEILKAIDKKLIETGQAMKRIDYNPPSETNERLLHLKAMFDEYSRSVVYPHTSEDLCLEFSYFKLMIRVQQELIFKAAKGENKLPNVKKLLSSKHDKGKKRQQRITKLSLWFDQINPGLRPYTKATKIREEMAREIRTIFSIREGERLRALQLTPRLPEEDQERRKLMEVALNEDEMKKELKALPSLRTIKRDLEKG